MATRVREKAAKRAANADKRPHATAKYIRISSRKAKS
jgi:large subunit ribosomal protein L22